MKQFDFTIRDELGIHARPAGMIVKKAKEFQSEIQIEKNGKTAVASQLFKLMSLGVRKGDTVTVTVTGEDEDAAFAAIETIFQENL